MSYLQRVLQTGSPLFHSSMAKLEHMAGRNGIDVRLIAMTHAARAIMRRLD